VIVIALGAGAFQKAVVVEEMEAPQDLLRAFTDEGYNVGRAEKTIPVNETNDGKIALRKLHWGNCNGAAEAGKPRILHSATITHGGATEEAGKSCA